MADSDVKQLIGHLIMVKRILKFISTRLGKNEKVSANYEEIFTSFCFGPMSNTEYQRMYIRVRNERHKK